MRRVVITGIGLLTPSGNDTETTWDSLISGRSGVGRITRFDPSGLSSRIAGEVKSFQPEVFIPKKDILRLDPFVHYAFAAAVMAAQDAELIKRNADAPAFIEGGMYLSLVTRHSSLDSAGIVIGSGRGGITSLEKAVAHHALKGKQFSAYLMSSSTINMAASYIGMRLGITGHTMGISTACASGTHAIGEAYCMIKQGRSDLVFAGGAEAPLCRLAVGGYSASGALSERNTEPEQASRPFDRDRDGFVVAEGAGILIAEELNHALLRGARIYAEIIGYGTSSDAFHQTQPHSEGESLAIRRALKDAATSPEEIHYINAHATSTVLGDAVEAEAIRKVFGAFAKEIFVSSCKSQLGHMLGAAGAVETAVTTLSLYRDTLIPTFNLEHPDPACELNHVTAVMKKEIRLAMTNSFGFGGVNAVLVLKKFMNP